MSRDVHSLVTMMKLLWKGGEMSKSDPECVPLPFDDKVSLLSLFFAFRIEIQLVLLFYWFYGY